MRPNFYLMPFLIQLACLLPSRHPIIVDILLANSHPVNCELEKKLDAIQNKIQQVSIQGDSLGFLVECGFVKNRLDQLRFKIEKLNDVIKSRNKQNIRFMCNNVGTSLQDIITELMYSHGSIHLIQPDSQKKLKRL